MKAPPRPKPKRTRLILDQALANVMNHRTPRTAFQKAVLKAIEGVPLRESSVPAYRKEWAKFCQLAGNSVLGAHDESLPRCCDFRAWTGRWTITNDDLLFLREVAMWIGRYDPTEETMADLYWNNALVTRVHKKRMWQAWQRFQQTGLTHEHLKLIAKARWFQNCWRGDGDSIHMDGKRPWGDSFKELSIYQICGWELPRNKADEVDMKPHHEEHAWNLFDELPFAIPAAALNAQQMEIGAFCIGYAQEGKIWIQHRNGEGMMTDAAKLEKHLTAFWRKEF